MTGLPNPEETQPIREPVEPESNVKGSILVVDDEAGVCDSLTEVLREEEYDVTPLADGREAMTAINSREFDIVLTDLWCSS